MSMGSQPVARSQADTDVKVAAGLFSLFCFLVNMSSLNPFCSLFLFLQATGVAFLSDLFSEISDCVDYTYINLVLLTTNMILDQTNLDCLFQAYFYHPRTSQLSYSPVFVVNERCLETYSSAGRFTSLTLIKIVLLALVPLLAQIPIVFVFFLCLRIFRIQEDVILKSGFGGVYELASAPVDAIRTVLNQFIKQLPLNETRSRSAESPSHLWPLRGPERSLFLLLEVKLKLN
ncbi:hypothetical protein EIP91_004217 [Steccherinum ochraceum]|uniref:Uncharacterized protein n=1 Tax=Steccherinum ochraceum TaxID=92696 RepID=A0A4R0RKM2_9APHY|nr:hypothetical protein EIP91_004217 [Steccherinum ochraceum]